jgi:hypothetical protein
MTRGATRMNGISRRAITKAWAFSRNCRFALSITTTTGHVFSAVQPRGSARSYCIG